MQRTMRNQDEGTRPSLLPPLSSVSEMPTDAAAEVEVESTRTAQKLSPTPPRVYGYTFDKDGVWFEYELNDETNLVTHSQTGARYRLDPQTEVRAAVAGNFNGWALIQMKRNPQVSNRFGTLVPRSALAGKRHEFKFILDGQLWVEPPTFASNTAPAGIGDPSVHNLVIALDREAKGY